MGIVARIGTSRRNATVAACLGVFAILAVVLYLPTGPFDSTRMPDGGFLDPGQSVWNLGWTSFAVEQRANVFHTSLIDYPAGANLANDNFTPLLGLLAMPVTLLAGPIASLNFLLRLAMFASATSMFRVLRPRCRWVLPAFLGGLLYGFGPYLASQSATDVHPSLAFSPLVPPILWCLYELIVVQRRSALRMGLLLGIFTGAQAYISTEVIADIGVVVFVALVVGIALHAQQGRAGDPDRFGRPQLSLPGRAVDTAHDLAGSGPHGLQPRRRHRLCPRARRCQRVQRPPLVPDLRPGVPGPGGICGISTRLFPAWRRSRSDRNESALSVPLPRVGHRRALRAGGGGALVVRAYFRSALGPPTIDDH